MESSAVSITWVAPLDQRVSGSGIPAVSVITWAAPFPIVVLAASVARNDDASVAPKVVTPIVSAAMVNTETAWARNAASRRIANHAATGTRRRPTGPIRWPRLDA